VLLLTPERTDPYSDQASQKAANQLDAIRGVALEVNRPLISANRWRHNVRHQQTGRGSATPSGLRCG